MRDITFSNDGRRFISTGYDKNIRVWDTETGAVIRTFNTGKVYYCVTLHPDAGKQNVLMAGCADKKIYQFDIDNGDTVQEYNYHLGAVNSVTFIEDGQRFITTSDDKSIRMWEFGIPVQIKYIADPSMHSMPAVTRSPNGNFLLMQSLDNQVGACAKGQAEAGGDSTAQQRTLLSAAVLAALQPCSFLPWISQVP